MPATSFIHFTPFVELSDAKTTSPVSLKVILRTGCGDCVVTAVTITHGFFLI